jgi:ubiquinone biosynthesis protein UbiJ
VHIEGDVQLAAEVNWLIDHVRWDVAEDLSGLIGDAAAHTLVSMGQQAVQALRQFARKAAPSADLHKAAP